jgi:nicotinamidase/pyrazinamidase
MDLQPGDALLIVDMQNDFCPGGALGVPEGDLIIPELNEWMAKAKRLHIPIFATRDWHPANHVSFEHRGGIWPVHCVQGSRGAEFHSDLKLPAEAIVISKATTSDTESYSAFGDTDLAQHLRAVNAKRVWIGGLALDYCVKETALDARALGLDVRVITSATRAVNARPEDGSTAMAQMKAAGVEFEEPRAA